MCCIYVEQIFLTFFISHWTAKDAKAPPSAAKLSTKSFKGRQFLCLTNFHVSALSNGWQARVFVKYNTVTLLNFPRRGFQEHFTWGREKIIKHCMTLSSNI